MLRALCLSVLLALTLSAASPASAVSIAVIGDSLSDEYQATQTNTRFLGYEGFTWVEILAAARGSEVDFGAFDPTLGVMNLPRGYDYNYALKGTKAFGGNVIADAADAGLLLPGFSQLDDIGQNRVGQFDSAATDVANGAVDAVVIWLGANDFNQRRQSGFSFDLANPNFQAFQNNIVTALISGIDQLIAAGATDILLGQIQAVDLTRVDIVTATADTNAKLLAALATRPQVTFFDPLAAQLAHFDAGTGTIQIAGFEITLAAAPTSTLVAPPGGVSPAQCGYDNVTNAAACPTVAYQSFALNDDATHFTTPMQGLIASSVIDALASRGIDVTPLSDAEILQIAGVPVPVAEPSSAALLAAAALAARRMRRARIALRAGQPVDRVARCAVHGARV